MARRKSDSCRQGFLPGKQLTANVQIRLQPKTKEIDILETISMNIHTNNTFLKEVITSKLKLNSDKIYFAFQNLWDRK